MQDKFDKAIEKVRSECEKRLHNSEFRSWMFLGEGYVTEHAIENRGLKVRCNEGKKNYSANCGSIVRALEEIDKNMKFITASCKENVRKKFEDWYLFPSTFDGDGAEDYANGSKTIAENLMEKIIKSATKIADKNLPDADVLADSFMMIEGDVGIGKTTFLNYWLSCNCQKLDENKCIWVRIDFNKELNSQCISKCYKSANLDEFYRVLYLQMFKILILHYKKKLSDIDVSFSPFHISNPFIEKIYQRILSSGSMIDEHIKIEIDRIYENVHDGTENTQCINVKFGKLFCEALQQIGIKLVFVIDGFDRVHLTKFHQEEYEFFVKRLFGNFIFLEHQRIGYKILSIRFDTCRYVNQLGVFPKGIEPDTYYIREVRFERVLRARLNTTVNQLEPFKALDQVVTQVDQLIQIMNKTIERGLDFSSIKHPSGMTALDKISYLFNQNYRLALNFALHLMHFLFWSVDRMYKFEDEVTLDDVCSLLDRGELVSKHYKMMELLLKGRMRIYRNRYDHFQPCALPAPCSRTESCLENVFYLQRYLSEKFFEPLLIPSVLAYLNKRHRSRSDVCSFVAKYIDFYHSITNFDLDAIGLEILDLIIDLEMGVHDSRQDVVRITNAGKFMLSNIFNLNYIENVLEAIPVPMALASEIVPPCAYSDKSMQVTARIRSSFFYIGVLLAQLSRRRNKPNTPGDVSEAYSVISKIYDNSKIALHETVRLIATGELHYDGSYKGVNININRMLDDLSEWVPNA